ncbi:MAG: IS66 family transposase [Neglectibacter timonensis]
MSNQSGMKDGESSMEQTEILLTIRRQLTMLQSTIDSLKEQSRQKDEEIERLRQIILNLQRAQFGQRSEKRTYVLDDGNQQLSLFDTPEKSEEKSSSEPSQNSEREIRVSGHSRKKKRTLEELCASLPVEERDPFWKRIRSELLTQSTIHADETVMQVLKEKGKPATSESRMWVYSSAKRADIQLRCFEYRESRSGKWAKTFLEGFSGVLITDGYSGYNKVQEAERAGCWAHMRRKWLEAMPEGADAKTCKAAEGYEFCNRLFELEHQFEELTAEERLIQRKEKSGPVLEAYWKWLNTIARPTGKLKDAVTYAQNQKAHLSAFLEHGEIEISNNQVENAIRPFVIGRKGWLFADTPQGAEASAIIYSLMETAKANSLRLDDYLLHLLSVLPERAEQDKDFEMDDLLPWSEEMKSWFSAV